MSVEAALEAAVLDLLQADAAVRAHLGDPIRGQVTAEGLPAYPFLEIAGHDVRSAGSDGVPGREHRLDLAIVSRADGPNGVRAPLDAVRAALDGARPQAEGWRCVLMHAAFSDVLAGRRGREVRGLIRFRIVLEAA